MSSYKKSTTFLKSTTNAELQIFLRCAIPNKMIKGAVLFIHGAIIPSIIFDVKTPSPSWLDYFASLGYASFALDLRGYGFSTKPKEMDEEVLNVQRQCTSNEAIQDIHDVVNWIKKECNLTHVNLCGLSWGSVLVGKYATSFSENVQKITMIGPVYAHQNPLWRQFFLADDHYNSIHPSIGGYRIITADSIPLMWNMEIPYEEKEILRDPNTLQCIVEDMIKSDQEWSDANKVPFSLRVPTGLLDDIKNIFNYHPCYAAEKIKNPTLLLRGEYDLASHPDDISRLFHALGSKNKYLFEMGDATHYALVEKKAPILQQMCVQFIENG